MNIVDLENLLIELREIDIALQILENKRDFKSHSHSYLIKRERELLTKVNKALKLANVEKEVSMIELENYLYENLML